MGTSINNAVRAVFEKERTAKQTKINLEKIRKREKEGLANGTLVSVDCSHMYGGVHTIKIMRKEKAIKLGLYKDEETKD